MMPEDRSWIAGVDIGGTKVAVSLARCGAPGRLQMLPATRCVADTAKAGAPDALAQQVLGLLDQALAQAVRQGFAPRPPRLEAVGVAACGPFVLHQGAVELATPNICGGLAGPARGLPNDWTRVPLEAPLRAALQARCPGGALRLRVENDAVAALEAERRWGALQGLDHCAYVTWSTGVGAGVCVDGRVLRGKNGNAGHAGHQFVCDDPSQALCGCGNVGDVEALVAGNALARYGGGAQALLEAAESGDAVALDRVEQMVGVLGRALYNLVVVLDLQAISLGGSVFLHHQTLLLPRLQARMQAGLPALTAGCRLVAAGLGAQVGDCAALALVAPPSMGLDAGAHG